MSLNLSNFTGASNPAPVQGNKAQSNQREDAKVWLNIGYPKTFTNDEGNEDTTFVSLARGIPLDQIEDFDLSRVTRSTMATLRRDQNNFRAALMAQADEMRAAGIESKLIIFDDECGIGIEMRIKREAAAPIEEDKDAPLPFKFR